MDFLWHLVSEEEKENIKKEAKRIMDSFAKALAKVGNERVDESVIRTEQTRKETNAECDESFRKMFMNNAPEKDDDFILAEKGKWKSQK